MRSTLVTDTSVVYAALDPRDRNHEPCARLIRDRAPIVVPTPVITETTILGRSRRNRRAAPSLVRSVVDGTLIAVELERQDYARVGQLLDQYEDLMLSFVDAAVVAIAERLNETTIATLDHRHFAVVKPVHCEAFTLLP